MRDSCYACASSQVKKKKKKQGKEGRKLRSFKNVRPTVRRWKRRRDDEYTRAQRQKNFWKGNCLI